MATTSPTPPSTPVAVGVAAVNLYWLPLGAGPGNQLVRLSGRLYEWLAARRAGRQAQALFHSALQVKLDEEHYVIEMAPVWSSNLAQRGTVGVGAVGHPWLGRSRLFRYEVRCWRGGIIDDLVFAVASPVGLSTDPERAASLLERVAAFPTATWGLDELGTGEMWNSNSLISWVLASSGHDVDDLEPPRGGRAPGWHAGLVVCARQGLDPVHQMYHPRGHDGAQSVTKPPSGVQVVSPTRTRSRSTCGSRRTPVTSRDVQC